MEGVALSLNDDLELISKCTPLVVKVRALFTRLAPVSSLSSPYLILVARRRGACPLSLSDSPPVSPWQPLSAPLSARCILPDPIEGPCSLPPIYSLTATHSVICGSGQARALRALGVKKFPPPGDDG